MKGKFGIAALIFSSITFAAPVSTPNQMSDTPIISGGGTVSSGTCKAYQTNGTAVPLSGGETLVFYGSGGGRWYYDKYGRLNSTDTSSGGYLSTKSNYSGTAYVRVKTNCNIQRYGGECTGSAIGLFARNTDSKNDFIAGAGAGGTGGRMEGIWAGRFGAIYDAAASSGGGWLVGGMGFVCYMSCGGGDNCSEICQNSPVYGGNVYSPNSLWFTTWYYAWPWRGTPGFHGGQWEMGSASSISAFYNSYTKNYTSFATSLTISGGGFYGQNTPTLYVCQ